MDIALDTNIRAARQLAAGRVTITFKSPTGTHITLTAKCRAPKETGNGWETSSIERAKVIFIEVPNDSGYGDKVGKITSRGFTPDPAADKARVWCAEQLLRVVAGQEIPPSLDIYVEDTCGKCGRALTDPISIERGLGPECFGASTGSQHQVKDKAQVVDAPAADKPQVDSSGRITHPSTTPDADGNVDVYLADSSDRVPLFGGPRPQRTLGWREEKQFVAEARADVTPAKPYRADRPCSQLSVLPGTTWEDIFR
jgi:hypothetical protein